MIVYIHAKEFFRSEVDDICIHMYIPYICMYIYICIHIYVVYIYIYTYVYIYIFISTYVYVYQCLPLHM